MNDWTATPPLRTLSELEAFYAMRKFLEIWWDAGGRSEERIAVILGSTNRTKGPDDSAPQGPPLDLALWDDWRDAVRWVLEEGSASHKDPLANSG